MAMRMQMNETHAELPREIVVALGRSIALSRHEIETTLVRSGRTLNACTVTSGAAIVKATPEPDTTWFNSLGGARLWGVVEASVVFDVGVILQTLLPLVGESRTIGLSQLGGKGILAPLASQLKRETASLKRYLLPSEGALLAPAQSKDLGNGDSEWLLLLDGDVCRIVRVLGHQDIDDFTRRDRGLPVLDMKRGMLPTKLARMMANIALGTKPLSVGDVLLDPFCGTGRILIESVLVGSSVLGADIDPSAVEATRQNLSWASTAYPIEGYDPEQILVSPIDKLSSLVSAGSIAAIATEPFLGVPANRLPTVEEREVRFQELVPQYEAFLRAGHELLRPAGRLVAVFPMIGEQSLFGRFVDRLPQFGYHLLDSIPVTRSDQWIARDIVLLENR